MSDQPSAGWRDNVRCPEPDPKHLDLCPDILQFGRPEVIDLERRVGSPLLNTINQHMRRGHFYAVRWWIDSHLDCGVFVILGAIVMRRRFSMDGTRLAILVAGAIVLAGGGLGLWFVQV